MNTYKDVNLDKYRVFLLQEEAEELYILMDNKIDSLIEGSKQCLLIPIVGVNQVDAAIELKTNGKIKVITKDKQVTVQFEEEFEEIQHETTRPHSDVLGNRFIFNMKGGKELSKTLAHFYWDTILPSVIEKTKGQNYPDWKGYVVSTLEGKYAGTYPDVDHEFQTKGRMALSGQFELDIVKRMIDLQFRMMKEDPTGLWRNPCAIQPDGTREYHVRRNSMDGTNNAEMFLVTGNIEIIETAWLYYARTKSLEWLQMNIENLEGALSLIEHLMDQDGRLWSDVFYEDQVIKDGMEAMSASLAANSFNLLAELELVLNRTEKAQHYKNLASQLEESLVQEPPYGFWDKKKKRFIDWIDRDGVSHDHIHLLANILPVLFKQANQQQSESVDQLILDYLDEFQRFPTFISAKIEDYTDAEIGDGGPYDLCAAGRYWCWDAAYWSDKGNGNMLLEQLKKVAKQAEIDNYIMGERYDMNHVYYIDDKNWHGAGHYYEYPNVFAWVLIHEYFGIEYGINHDMILKPKLQDYAEIVLEGHGIAFKYEADRFSISNVSNNELNILVDLSLLSTNEEAREVILPVGETQSILF